MSDVHSRIGTMIIIASAFIVPLTWCEAFSAEGVGGVLQQLEKSDKTPVPTDKSAPAIEKQHNKPVVESKKNVRKFTVKRFRLEGNTLISEKELLSDVTLGEGREMSLDEITRVADMVTAKYRARGFLIAYAYVPSQSIFDGAVIIKGSKGYSTVNAFGSVLIRVVEGKVGTISVTGNSYYSSSFIERYLRIVRNDRSLKEETLEKELLLLNDYPSLSVKATLKAGKEKGTTDIIASVSDKYPIFGTVSIDNFGVSATSKNRMAASLNVGNTITSGDLIKLYGLIGLDDINPKNLSYGRAEYVIPVGGLGTQFGTYYSNTAYNAAGNDSFALLGLNGKADVIGVYVTHPLVKRYNEALSLRIGSEYISLHDNLLGNTQDKDEIRKITAGISYESTDKFMGRNFVSFGYARGLGGILGGTSNNATNPGPSYPGANNTFNKLSLDMVRIQKLPGYNHLIASGGFQYSPDRMFSEERMQIGGEGSVRGFSPGKLSGDNGYFLSLELLSSPLFPEKHIFNQTVGDTIKFVLFSDFGGVVNTNPRPSEMTESCLSSIGAGVRLYGANVFTLKLDWAIPGKQGGYGDFTLKDNQVYFQTVVSF